MSFEFSFFLNSLIYSILFLLLAVYLRRFPALNVKPKSFSTFDQFSTDRKSSEMQISPQESKNWFYIDFSLSIDGTSFSYESFVFTYIFQGYKNNLYPCLASYYFKGIPSPKAEAIDTIELITPSILVNFSNGFLAFSLSPFSI